MLKEIEEYLDLCEYYDEYVRYTTNTLGQEMPDYDGSHAKGLTHRRNVEKSYHQQTTNGGTKMNRSFILESIFNNPTTNGGTKMNRNETVSQIVNALGVDPFSATGAQIVQTLHTHLDSIESPNKNRAALSLADMPLEELLDLSFNAQEHALNAVRKDVRNCVPWTINVTGTYFASATDVPVEFVYAASAHRALRDELRGRGILKPDQY